MGKCISGHLPVVNTRELSGMMNASPPTDPSVHTGIVTKPDSLVSGSVNEKFFASLPQNKEIEFRLGWHVLKNPDSEKGSFSLTRRNLEEEEFFSKNIWQDLPAHLLGVANLRPRLSDVLTKQLPQSYQVSSKKSRRSSGSVVQVLVRWASAEQPNMISSNIFSELA